MYKFNIFSLKSRICFGELQAHKSLRNDNSIIVTKPDKANGVVVINRTDYVSKMEDILSDASKFSLSNNDDHLQNLTKY